MEPLTKDQKRLNRIIKQGDRQQRYLIELNDKVEEQKKELNRLYNYDISQQLFAKNKLESLIINDFKESTKTIFKASDVLSGDYYSVHKLNNGATLIYLLDGQGHGIAPALTIYAISSNIQQVLQKSENFEDIVETLFIEIRKFLAEEEQISFTFIYLENETDDIKYVSGGTYPFLLKTEKEVLKFKANNLPFMSFSQIPKITTVTLKEGYKSILVYSDGLVEDESDALDAFKPLTIIENPNLIEKLEVATQNRTFDDDITVIYYE